jgi:hypothetical protein
MRRLSGTWRSLVDFSTRIGVNRTMRSAQFLLPLLVGVCIASSLAGAQTITVSGASALTIITAIAGAQLTPVSTSNATYSVTTSFANQKIVGHIQPALPPNVALTITLGAPTLATSSGPVQLTSSDQTLVSGILVPATYNALAIHYTLSATVAAGVIGTTTYQVVFTVVNGLTETADTRDKTRETIRAGDRW